MSNNCGELALNMELAKLDSKINTIRSDVTKLILAQDTIIAEMIKKFNSELPNTIENKIEELGGDEWLSEYIKNTLSGGLVVLDAKTSHIVNVREFGATGKALCDESDYIQRAIDYANEHGREVYIPAGEYMISKPIVLNGCSLYGATGNIYSGKGTVITCMTKDFTAIEQGSTSTNNIMFNIKDISVKNANVGFEFVYVINSHFTNLYATNCNTGIKIGRDGSVGCMFCDFTNLYTSNCEVGVEAISSEYMNNNRFVNGFVQGNNTAMTMSVKGGYGAVGNTFENVEFRSSNGRGIVLTSCLNTNFNQCYFECGGNAIRMSNYCSIHVNGCTFGVYKKNNTFNDINVVYSVGGGAMTIDGGIIFLDADYTNTVFFGSGNVETHQNVTVVKNIAKNGIATGFEFFSNPVNEVANKVEEQVVATGTIVAAANSVTNVPFTFANPFSGIPNVVIVTMRGGNGTASDVSYVVSERLATGGIISVSNTGNNDRSLSFSVYAKRI